MKILKKDLFNYLDKYTFSTTTELENEINQWICRDIGAKYYTQRKETKNLMIEYLITRNYVLSLKK